MDPTRFDDLARVLSAASGRRPLLGALLGLALGRTLADASARKRRAMGNGRSRKNRESDDRLQSERRGKGGKRRKKKRGPRGNGGVPPDPPAAACCGTKRCAPPESGGARSGCEFGGQSFAGQNLSGSIFRGIDGRNADFSSTDSRGSVFAEACLQGARFRNAVLDGSSWEDACLFSADFAGADLDGDDPLFAEARFCNTRMPNGSLNDRDCGRETACCRRGNEPPGPECRPDGAACVQDSDCCGGNCFGQVCADRPEFCLNTTCPGNAVGCCQDACCLTPSNQCNPGGLCCAPNCAGKQCGPDGCGGGGACGTCPTGTTCNSEGRCVCIPQSCPDGCCDGDGDCQPGDSGQECGTGGVACVECGPGSRCRNQRCECAPDCGGRECGPDGCGGSCGTCSPDQVCDDDDGECLCTRQSCPGGCCSDGPGNPGTCQPGNAPAACGAGGAECEACDDDELCQNGQCVACDARSCPDGCCGDGPGNTGVCRPGSSRQACGSGGEQCATCPQGQDCLGGRCAVCGPETCPDGCCAANGTCQPGGAFGACGGPGGGPCASCNDSQTCQNRQCVACGPNCACTGQSVCVDENTPNVICGPGGDCNCFLSQSGEPFCGGQVTFIQNGCGSDAECQQFETGSFCVAAFGDGVCDATGDSFCVAPCFSCTPQTCASGCCSPAVGCTPGTTTQACGDDGETCQVCGAGEGCLERRCQACVPKTCQELAIACGPASDGCGGTLQCGSCPLGETPSCQDGVCRACADVCSAECTECYQTPEGATICGGNAFVDCSSPCSSDADCDDTLTCVASGVDRDTGEGQTLAEFCQKPGVAGVCLGLASCCQPDCAGKACGDDGCNGSCGECGQCQECQGGTCQASGLVCGGQCCALKGTCCTDTTTPYCCEEFTVCDLGSCGF